MQSPHSVPLPWKKTDGRCHGTSQGEKERKEKGLAAPAISKTLPLPSYNKQEKQNQNTAPTSLSIHAAQAALLPATTHKQLRCEPPQAHPSRWPEQQKSPAQEAHIQYTGCLKSFPGSAEVLHAPLPAPVLEDAGFCCRGTAARHAGAGNRDEYWLQSWQFSH